MRVGHGFDVHRFGGKGPLIIGGVSIPFLYRLISHSDGDVVIHAVIDALLGGAALGNIGLMFPDSDMQFKNINSRNLLKLAWLKVVDKGYRLGNLDVSIVAQTPQITPYIFQMCSNFVEDLDCHMDAINIKAGSTEKLGCIGRSEGIACEAIVALTKII